MSDCHTTMTEKKIYIANLTIMIMFRKRNNLLVRKHYDSECRKNSYKFIMKDTHLVV